MALVTRFWRVTIAHIAIRLLMRVIANIIASFLSDIIATIIEWHLWRVTRAMTQVILRIVIADLVTRTLRRVISRMVACFLPSDICALRQVLFMARYSPYKAGSFDPLL